MLDTYIEELHLIIFAYMTKDEWKHWKNNPNMYII